MSSWLDLVSKSWPSDPAFPARPGVAACPRPPSPARSTVLKLGKRLSGVAPLKWKVSKCLKSSRGCRGLVGRDREASRGLGALEAGPAAGGRRAGSEMGGGVSQGSLFHHSQSKRLMGFLGVETGQKFRSPSSQSSTGQAQGDNGPSLCLRSPQLGEQELRLHSTRLPAQKDDPPAPTEAQMNP